MRKRTLANGLDVVLLPVTSVPTVEIRLVFGSGSADEPEDQRGAARAAAWALDWNPQYLADLIRFAAGGGTHNIDVGTDHTAFTARGVDMHLDLLLVGLRRFVRDGIYAATDIAAIRKAARGAEDEPIADSWRAALFGANHPYAHAYTISPMLSLAAIETYRRQHHTPGNATLVIAGRFDAALADQWIDHLFGDWRGAAPPTSSVHATTEPTSIANDDEEVTQMAVAMAMPAGRGNRAEQLVAAAMLDVIVEDIRHQLGASYAFGAGLDEARLATTYVAAGWIDAPRARDAFELVRGRLAELRADPDAAARAFITARRRVIVKLLSATSSAAQLAERVQRDITLERAPLSDAQTAEAVNQLTIDKMSRVLEEIDLSRAVVVMRGPRATIDDAFAALGRTPVRIAVRDDDETKSVTRIDDDSELSNLEDPSKPSGSRWTLGGFLGYTSATVTDQEISGFSIGADVGYRFKRQLAAGLHVSRADLEATYEPSVVAAEPVEISASAVRLMGFLQASAADDRLWGAGFAGLSLVNVTDNSVSSSSTAFGVGVQGGYDVANFGKHHITVYGRIEADIASSASFAGFTFGAGYRFR